MLHATETIYVSNYLYLGLEFVISLMLVVYIQINYLITRQKPLNISHLFHQIDRRCHSNLTLLLFNLLFLTFLSVQIPLCHNIFCSNYILECSRYLPGQYICKYICIFCSLQSHTYLYKAYLNGSSPHPNPLLTYILIDIDNLKQQLDL